MTKVNNTTNCINFQLGNIKRSVPIPSGWNDLDERSLLLFYNTLFTAPGGALTQVAFTTVKLLSMAQHLLNLQTDILTRWEADCLKEDPEHGETIFLDELRTLVHAALSGLFDIQTNEDDGSTSYAVKFNLTKNPYDKLAHTPVLKNKKQKPKTTWHFAPSDGLSNFTLYEMGYTFTLYEQYVETMNDAIAEELIAVLYRPARPQTADEVASGWNGDRRQPLRRYESKVPERAELVKGLPALTKRIILFWFASCRQAIVETYPAVFKKGKSEGGSSYGWGGVMLAIADGPAALDVVADQHYSNGLTWLSMKADEMG